jgi:hypothetical protein
MGTPFSLQFRLLCADFFPILSTRTFLRLAAFLLHHHHLKNVSFAPVILGVQEAEIRRTMAQSQPGQIVHETLSGKHLEHKKRAGGVAQGVDPEFKPQYQKKKRTLHRMFYQVQ